MVKTSKGLRHRSRKIMKKNIRERGAVPSLSKVTIDYRIGDKVYIDVDPAIHGGMPHRRYIGRVGTIVEVRGRGLVVEVEIGSKKKTLFLLPEHVKPAFDLTKRLEDILIKLKELSKIRKEQRKTLLTILNKTK
uniref:Large ribosomal subunit protein eL21 n=1 Tax=Ignisphaera aggregans TaxID=334771 RepID=A0A7C5UUK7_9CREN